MRYQYELRPAIRDLVFIHIPKTAGTALRNALANALPKHTKLFDYKEENSVGREAFVTRKGSRLTAADIAAWRKNTESNRSLFLAGHIFARRYINAFHPADFVTFLRDPVERLVSSYKHHIRLLGFTGSFADFYNTPKQINLQSRMLRGIDLRNIGFVGLTEFMPDMIDALSRHLDAPLSVKKENVGLWFGQPTVDKDVRADILALNEDDVRLYEHVKLHRDAYTNFRMRAERPPYISRAVARPTRAPVMIDDETLAAAQPAE